MNFCPFCGQKLPGDSAFCPYCGGSLAGAAQTPPAQTAPVQTAPAPKKRRVWAWGLAAVLVLALAAGGFLVWQAFSKPDISTFSPSVLYLEGYDEEEYVLCSGSGFFIENGPEGDPLLVTNYHVIEGCAGLDVWDSNFENYVQARSVVAYDEVVDLAILRCEPGLDVAPLTLAGEDVGIQGDEVYAIGYPLGIANTLSNGIISSRYYDEYDVDVLQITAPVSEGSSGGALLNEDGLVVGVIAASYVDGENMNLAIAAHQVSSLLANAGEEMTMGAPPEEVPPEEVPPVEVPSVERPPEEEPRWRTLCYVDEFDPDNYLLITFDDLYADPVSYIGKNVAIFGNGYLSTEKEYARLHENPDNERDIWILYEDTEDSLYHMEGNRYCDAVAYGEIVRGEAWELFQTKTAMPALWPLQLHAYEYYA